MSNISENNISPALLENIEERLKKLEAFVVGIGSLAKPQKVKRAGPSKKSTHNLLISIVHTHYKDTDKSLTLPQISSGLKGIKFPQNVDKALGEYCKEMNTNKTPFEEIPSMFDNYDSITKAVISTWEKASPPEAEAGTSKKVKKTPTKPSKPSKKVDPEVDTEDTEDPQNNVSGDW